MARGLRILGSRSCGAEGLAGVAVDFMKPGRLGLYVAGATVGVGLAYLLAILPYASTASTDAPKAVAKKEKGKGRAPAPVTAATVIASDMPVILTAPGTVEPFANVAVKTRVDGQITEVLFKEGDLVNESDILFRLDDRLVKAQIAQAEASIAKDQAALRDAEATLVRREALIDRKIVTEASLDQARYAVEGSEGEHRCRHRDARDPEERNSTISRSARRSPAAPAC